MTPRYLVGIDLGTTNSALAFIDLKGTSHSAKPKLEAFSIAQLTAPGEVGPRPLLPSFLYRPSAHELASGATSLPWNSSASDPVGEFARELGASTPGRLVSSAKSWLCHPGVDRRAPLLPWGAPSDVVRLSPLEASARYLKHIVDAWNHAHPATDDHLQKLPVVLTVPASFDDIARTLTVEAASLAGLKNVILLEEPQAAFYAWRHEANNDELAKFRAGMNCLVVDVGGGTTDLSLISAVEREGDIHFVRDAVGDHLLLGGDNMDLALARQIETRLSGGRLDPSQFVGLVQACRRGKEALLAPEPPSSFPVTVIGRGKSVVGGTLSIPLTLDDIRQIIFEGFFPSAKLSATPLQAARAALHELGLPYAQDAAITRHLAAFLSQHLATQSIPEAILFNGGVFQPELLRQRLLETLRPWYEEAGQSMPVILKSPSLDFAVAYGAAAYAWARHTGKRIIEGGTARSYYVEVHPAGEQSTDIHVVCAIPRHMTEGLEVQLDNLQFDLALGEPVIFPLYTSTARDDDAGSVLTVAPGQLKRIPSVQTILRGGKRGKGTPRSVAVKLAARTTAIGTLELSCVALDGGQRWQLEFGTRDIIDEDSDDEAGESNLNQIEILPESMIAPASELIQSTYHSDASGPNELVKSLESQLELPRDEWPIPLCRRLWESVAQVADNRRRSPAHLARWYNLAGFLLRPGFGDPLDRYRVETLWKLLNAPRPGEAAPAEPVGADSWIMWRRVAGGLSVAHQKTLYDRLRAILVGGKNKAAPRPGANELAEMWRAAASLERLPLSSKTAMGETLIKQMRPGQIPQYAFWVLGRLGARQLLHGPLNGIVHPDTVMSWIDAVVKLPTTHESERTAWGFCLAQLARQTGQRALDVDISHRTAVIAALRSSNAPEAWIKMVEEVVSRGTAEQSQIFGDSLPVGLRLRQL